MAKKAYIGVPSFEPVELPSGYTQVEYIESHGTEYIDTGFKPDSNTRVICEFMPLDSTKAYGIFGSRTAYRSSAYNLFVGDTGTHFQDDYNSTSTTNVEAVANTLYVIDKNKNVSTINGTQNSVAYSSFEVEYSMYLFGVNTSGTVNSAQLGALRMYSCSIYDNDILVRYYIPCTSSTGAVGLYDTVSGVFYPNAGTGTFTVGSSQSSEVARQIKKIYLGINNIARKVKKGYVGVAGVARPFWTGGELSYYGQATDLQTAKRFFTGTANNNYAIFAGGYPDTATVDAYNSSLTKTTPANLNRARRTFASASINGKALFFGGYYSTYSSAYNGSPYTDVYNDSLTHTTATNLSNSPWYNAAASNNNYAINAGGMVRQNYDDGSHSLVPTAIVNAYNSGLTRSIPTALSEARFNHTAASNGDVVFFAGGSNENGVYGRSATVDSYNNSLTRTKLTNLSTQREELAGINVGDYALFAGGNYGFSMSGDYVDRNTVDAYNRSLTRIPADSLSVARTFLAATKIGEFAIFVAGDTYLGKGTNTVDVYDLSLTHTISVSLPVSLYDMSAATIGDKAIIAGGSNGNSQVKTVYVYTA